MKDNLTFAACFVDLAKLHPQLELNIGFVYIMEQLGIPGKG